MLFMEEQKEVSQAASSDSQSKTENTQKKPSSRSRNASDNKGGGRRPQRGGNNRRQPSEFEERMVDLARVTTVTKGGRRFSFAAIVVIGNKKGKVAWGHGKANEVPDAIKKAIKDAKTRIVEVPIIDGRTVPHENTAKFLSSRVLVKPAPQGKGLIAGGSVRAVVELAGYKDIYTKSMGSRSKSNSIKATIKALSELKTVEQVAAIRGITPKEVLD